MSAHARKNAKSPGKGVVGDEVESTAVTVVPVVEERIDVRTRVSEGAALRLRKLVHEEVVTVEEPLTTEVTEVERVAIGRPVDEAVAVRYEGETMIVPVLEERLVTRRQWVLVEEIRLTRRSVETRPPPRDVVLRREEVIAERLDRDTNEWKPVDVPAVSPA